VIIIDKTSTKKETICSAEKKWPIVRRKCINTFIFLFHFFFFSIINFFITNKKETKTFTTLYFKQANKQTTTMLRRVAKQFISVQQVSFTLFYFIFFIFFFEFNPTKLNFSSFSFFFLFDKTNRVKDKEQK